MQAMSSLAAMFINICQKLRFLAFPAHVNYASFIDALGSYENKEKSISVTSFSSRGKSENLLTDESCTTSLDSRAIVSQVQPQVQAELPPPPRQCWLSSAIKFNQPANMCWDAQAEIHFHEIENSVQSRQGCEHNKNILEKHGEREEKDF